MLTGDSLSSRPIELSNIDFRKYMYTRAVKPTINAEVSWFIFFGSGIRAACKNRKETQDICTENMMQAEK